MKLKFELSLAKTTMILDKEVKVRRGRGQQSITFLNPSLIENGPEIVVRGLIEGFQCFAPVQKYKMKPNISNCIDGSLHYGRQSYQL